MEYMEIVKHGPKLVSVILQEHLVRELTDIFLRKELISKDSARQLSSHHLSEKVKASLLLEHMRNSVRANGRNFYTFVSAMEESLACEAILKIFKDFVEKSTSVMQEETMSVVQQPDKTIGKIDTRICDKDLVEVEVILQSVGSRWRTIGMCLGFLIGELDAIEADPMLMMDAPNSYLKFMLHQWVEWFPGDGRGSKQYATTMVLYKALIDSDLKVEAEKYTNSLAVDQQLTDKDHDKLFLQLRTHASRWRDIAAHLGFFQEELDRIQRTPTLLNQGPSSYLSEVLSQWLQWAPGDGRGSTDFAKLSALKLALSATGLGHTAHNVKL